MITADQAPDHATIARFRVRHERALSELFRQMLGLCADAGLMRVGVVAVDGTKVQTLARSREGLTTCGSAGIASGDDGGAVVVRLRDRRAVVAAD